jgi:tetratricopeptide (TPR) repeat protein
MRRGQNSVRTRLKMKALVTILSQVANSTSQTRANRRLRLSPRRVGVLKRSNARAVVLFLLVACAPVLSLRRGATPETISLLAHRISVVPHGEAAVAQRLVTHLQHRVEAKASFVEWVLPAASGRPAGPVDLVIHLYVNTGTQRTVGLEAVSPSGQLLASVAQAEPASAGINWAETLVDEFYDRYLRSAPAGDRTLEDDEVTREGCHLLRTGRFEAARRSFELAQLKHSRSPSPLYNLGVLAEAEGKLEAARSYYREALRLGPHAFAAEALASLPPE